MKQVRALVLLSGGLDSILAAKVLILQKIKVTGLSFKSYFFGVDFAKKAAQDLGIKIKIIDFSKEHLKMVKNPKYGYGKSMNPCLDCHILMLKKAKKIKEKEKFNLVATGEVLGERPMSQNPRALKLVEAKSSLRDYLLRPLSAKLLKKTLSEEIGLVNREKLLDISGRSRKRQIKLAKNWKIKWYPTPAGGCLLTDLEFGKRLRELFEKHPKCNGNDIELLKVGRHFCLALCSPKGEGGAWSKIVIGRNHQENLKIKKLAKKGDILVEMKNYPGPTTLIRNYSKVKIPNQILEKAQSLTQYYSPKTRDKKGVNFQIKSKL